MRGQQSFTPPVSGTTEADQDRRTPPALVLELARRFGRGGFDFDAACSEANCVCRQAMREDGYLPGDLDGWDSLDGVLWRGRVWCNPPWNNIGLFVRKAAREMDRGNAEVVVFLVPARTSMPWWHYAMRSGFRQHDIVGRVAYGGSGSAPFEHSTVLVLDRPIEAGDYR